MGIISQESINALKAHINTVDVVASYITLQQYGGVHKALCPFHSEKTPSFVVKKDFFHCFGCGIHGDAIKFIMDHLHCGFRDAIETLAQRYSIPLDELEDRSKIDHIQNCIAKIRRWYSFCLLHTPGGHLALKYLYERGITKDMVLKFQLGYAAEDDTLLFNYAKENSIKKDTLLELGILNSRGRGFFNGRIIIPIVNHFGSVVAFTARKFTERDKRAKYINSKESILFKKSSLLFGFYYAKPKIVQKKEAVIVEGQIDCLRLLDAGIDTTIATQGTACSTAQVKALALLGVKRVYTIFDSDKAGLNATEKLGSLFQEHGIEVLVVRLPASYDPDSFVIHFGADAVKAKMGEARDYLNFLVEKYRAQYDITKPLQKSLLVKKIKNIITSWTDPVLVDESLYKLAHYTETAPEAVLRQKITKKEPTLNAIDRDLIHWLFVVKNSASTLR